jgi:hypothetical protein
MPERRRAKPLLPPDDGWWLAHDVTRQTSFYSVQYLRPLSEAESAAVRAAWSFFASWRFRSEIEPLLDAYQHWLNSLNLALGSARLGSRGNNSIAENALISFLLVWRMTLDQLANATSSRFGKDSKQWHAYQAGRKIAYDTYFGYRVVEAMRNQVQHQERPALTQEFKNYSYICERCSKEHADLDLSITMHADWLLKSGQCPRVLKTELEHPANAIIEIREAIRESMQGFDDLLYTLLMSDDKAQEHLAVLLQVFSEASPDVPFLVKSWKDESGESQATIVTPSDMDWVIARAAASPNNG